MANPFEMAAFKDSQLQFTTKNITELTDLYDLCVKMYVYELKET